MRRKLRDISGKRTFTAVYICMCTLILSRDIHINQQLPTQTSSDLPRESWPVCILSYSCFSPSQAAILVTWLHERYQERLRGVTDHWMRWYKDEEDTILISKIKTIFSSMGKIFVSRTSAQEVEEGDDMIMGRMKSCSSIPSYSWKIVDNYIVTLIF